MKKVLLAALALMSVAVANVNAKVTTGSSPEVKMTAGSCPEVKMTAGDKPKEEEKRALKGFERIRLLGSLDVKYRQGKEFSVVVKAPQSLMKKVETRVEGNTLVVNMRGEGKLIRFGSVSGDDVTVYVTSPDLIGIDLKGSGDFDCKTHLDTDNLELSVRGSGDVELSDVICDRVNASIIGSGDVKIRKLVTQQTRLSVIGSGEMDINQQKVKQTQIEIKGSGDVKVVCKDCGSIESRIFGSGDIKLSGDVKEHKITKRGTGDYDISRLTITKK